MKKILFSLFLMLGIMAKAQTPYQIGAIAADFNLKNVDGKSISLANYKDAKGYIIVFTCNTCPVAKAYQARVENLHQEYAKKGYPVIAINTNDPIASPGDNYEQMQLLAKEKNISYAYVEDPDHIFTKTYGALKTPHTFILQKTAQGNQVAYIGAIDNDQQEENINRENYVKNALESLLKGEQPKVTTTKAVGCSIKWKKTSTSK
jgi:peroxiredoxin